MTTALIRQHSALLQQAAEQIATARHLTAFTGAGISVESGIPPFRGPGGIWNKYDPEVLDLHFFQRDPEQSWAAIREMFTCFLGTADQTPVLPNAAHQVLGEWEAAGVLKVVITQNIDGLHAAAGSRNLVEYHGHCRSMTCLDCAKELPLDHTTTRETVPRCDCGGLLKPDFIFFGEGIPSDMVERSEAAARQTDCMLLVGTSGAVYPAAFLPVLAKRLGAFIIEINPEPTEFTSGVTDLHLPLPAGAALMELNTQVNRFLHNNKS
ncbi:MAG TPA: NAD-dependent deacylase [Kiritimatiellia bacterium]|nr:MAG: NAD-dependent protein deacetylase [Verrucomicrobia bacterium ADurb.Bin018]HOD99983.1 NAD-dependent deacylase [Kiritimatiellia bacterium]